MQSHSVSLVQEFGDGYRLLQLMLHEFNHLKDSSSPNLHIYAPRHINPSFLSRLSTTTYLRINTSKYILRYKFVDNLSIQTQGLCPNQHIPIPPSNTPQITGQRHHFNHHLLITESMVVLYTHKYFKHKNPYTKESIISPQKSQTDLSSSYS